MPPVNAETQARVRTAGGIRLPVRTTPTTVCFAQRGRGRDVGQAWDAAATAAACPTVPGGEYSRARLSGEIEIDTENEEQCTAQKA